MRSPFSDANPPNPKPPQQEGIVTLDGCDVYVDDPMFEFLEQAGSSLSPWQLESRRKQALDTPSCGIGRACLWQM